MLLRMAEIKRKRGRPRKDFSKQQVEILNRIARGEPLLYILKTDGMPSERQFYLTLLNDKQYLQKYREAKQVQAHAYADKSIMIIMATHARVKSKTAERQEVQSAKNMADEYKWQAGKLAPKLYGKISEIYNEENIVDQERIIKIHNYLSDDK